MEHITVVVPIFNSETTLKAVLSSLESQQGVDFNIVLIDDDPRPNPCDQIIQEFCSRSARKVTAIKRLKNLGLAAAYNEAAAIAESGLLVTLQADVVIPQSDGLATLVAPILNDPTVVLTCAFQETPWEIWASYNFWQKCLFARHVGKKASGRNGRFCCFSLRALKEVGYFNSSIYRTAGEDGDILIKLRKLGRIVDVSLVVKHLHRLDPHFSMRDYFRKENQLAEAQGALLAHHFVDYSWQDFVRIMARPCIVIGLFIPCVNHFVLVLMLVYAYIVTDKVFLHMRDWRLIFLPCVNICMLFTFVFYFAKGFVTRKQQL